MKQSIQVPAGPPRLQVMQAQLRNVPGMQGLIDAAQPDEKQAVAACLRWS